MIRTIVFLLICALSWDARAASKVREDGGWPEIPAEERALTRVEQAPDTDLVILRNERNGKILKRADDWVNVMTYHWRAKILTEAGKRLDEITHVTIHAGKNSRLSDLSARTVKPDGTVVAVQANQMFEKVTTSGGTRASEWVFSFPAVETGAMVEYRYTRHDDYLAYLRPFEVEGGAFTLRARFTQAMLSDMGYQFLCSRCPPGSQPTVKNWTDGPAKGTIYSLELSNIPGYRREMLMPPRGEVTPRLEMVLASWKYMMIPSLGRQDKFLVDWPSVGRHAEYSYEEVLKTGRAPLRAAVSEWTQGIEAPEEKLRAVYRHVRDDFRYIAWETVVGGSRSVASLLEDRTADNEEKAVLLKGALDLIGVPSHIALVAGRQGGILNPEFFSLSQFTHAAVALSKPDGTFEWLDPTLSYGPYGFLSWKDAGAKALLVDGAQSRIVEIPQKTDPNRERFDVTVRIRDDGTASLSIKAEYGGEDAVEERNRLVSSSSDSQQKTLTEWLQARLPGAVLQSHQLEHGEDTDQPFVVRMEATAPGLVTQADDVLLVRASLLSGFSSNPIHEAGRTHPLCIDRAWNVQEEVVIEPPPGMSVGELPAPVRVESGMARFSFQCSKTANHAKCLRVFTAGRKRWPPQQISAFSKMMDTVVLADRTQIACQKAEVPPPD